MAKLGRRRRSAVVVVAADEADRRCRAALEAVGTPSATAAIVAGALVRNERRGRPSHGLLRLVEYLDAVAAGELRPDATPTVRRPSGQVRVVDGERGFGVLAAERVAGEMRALLRDNDVAVVALVNSNHIGALGDVGAAIAARGAIAIGFVNYLGAGQRVIPWRARAGRLCTNPMLVAVPSEAAPFVLDMSTSTVSEGAVRHRLMGGRAVPRGWLVDEHWRAVVDPARLYTDPPTAYMTPVGGRQAGHKGFGLGLAVELLAGVVTGAGSCAAPALAGPGNGGLFIGLRPELCGLSEDALCEAVATLRRHTTTDDGGATVARWPGDQAPTDGDDLRVEAAVWSAVERATDAPEAS